MPSTSLGQECQPFDMTPPDEPLFDPAKVVIVSNGRYGAFLCLVSFFAAEG